MGNSLIYMAVSIFICLPVVILIHELGHAIVGTICGRRIKLIVLGRGEKLIRIMKFQINTSFFLGGCCYSEESEIESKLVNILFLLGGVFSNLLAAIILLILIRLSIIDGYVWGEIMELSFVTSVGNLIPLSFLERNSDGKQIYQQLRYGYSSLNSRYNNCLKELMMARQSFRLSDKGKYNEALSKANEVLEINPDFSEAYYSKGHTLTKLERYSEALEVYKKLLDKNPEDLTALVGIAIVYIKTGNYDKCLEYYTRAYRVDSRNVVVLNNLADYYKVIGNYDKALFYIGEALKINKDYDLVYSTLSEIYLDKGDMDMFYKYFEKALKLEYKIKDDYEKEYLQKVVNEKRYKDLIKKYCLQE